MSAIIVTRGDVDLAPVLESLRWEWEIVIWDNSSGYVKRQPGAGGKDWNTWVSTGRGPAPADLSVYGRYAAIEYASHDLIYVQDDDVIVSDPRSIVDEWGSEAFKREYLNHLVGNMPQEFRHDGYTDSCLVGFGACFHRDLPGRSFSRFMSSPEAELLSTGDLMNGGSWFNRTCDVVFTTLAPARVLVDVPITHREFASDPNRMWKQPNHVSERARMLDLARAVRDGRKS